MKPNLPLFLILAFLSTSAAAESGLSVERAWMRPTATSTGAVYLTLRNGGDEPVMLTGVECSPANCMIHESSEQSGLSTMHMMDELALPPHGEIVFKPGTLHIMAMGLNTRLAEGATFPVILHFKNLTDLAVPVTVRKGPPR